LRQPLQILWMWYERVCKLNLNRPLMENIEASFMQRIVFGTKKD